MAGLKMDFIGKLRVKKDYNFEGTVLGAKNDAFYKKNHPNNSANPIWESDDLWTSSQICWKPTRS